jgi:hypothetical protein
LEEYGEDKQNERHEGRKRDIRMKETREKNSKMSEKLERMITKGRMN